MIGLWFIAMTVDKAADTKPQTSTAAPSGYIVYFAISITASRNGENEF